MLTSLLIAYALLTPLQVDTSGVTATTIDIKTCEEVANTYRTEWKRTMIDLEAEKKKKEPLVIQDLRVWHMAAIAVGFFGAGAIVATWVR